MGDLHVIQIKFTTFGANSAFGSFAPGDKLRCSPELAKHLVEELRCAKYAEAHAEQEITEAKPVARRQKQVKGK